MIQFVVITKWSKINNTGPGYINHYRIENIFQMLNNGSTESEALLANNIPPENFNRQIYENYYMYIYNVQRTPIIFETVPPNELGVSYSMGVYENAFTDDRDPAPRTAFLSLLGVTADKVSGNYDMSNYTGGFADLEEIYNYLKNA